MGIFLKDMSLKGKTALITGATKGLGRGAAEAIAEAGGVLLRLLFTHPPLHKPNKDCEHL